jgi:hypothetical protein
MTQVQFAAAIGRSSSWVSQVERGDRVVDRQSMLQKLAAVLGVPAREFVAKDADEVERWERPAQRSAETLRAALAGHPDPATVLHVGGRLAKTKLEPRKFRERTAKAWSLVHASAYNEAAPALAELIGDLEHATRIGGTQRQVAYECLAVTYQAAAAVLVKLDDAGAAWVAADRAVALGERCDDPLLILAGQLRLAHLFVQAGELSLARHVLRQVLNPLGDVAQSPEPSLLSLVGSCALLLSVLEARDDNAQTAERHLAFAEGLARRVGEDRNDFDTEFGPTNVAMHRVAVDVELGNAGEALLHSRTVKRGVLSAEREARFLIDVARAQTMRRDLREAVTSIEEAEKLAPEETRNLGLAHDLLVDLVYLAGRSPVTGLRSLAERLGIARN